MLEILLLLTSVFAGFLGALLGLGGGILIVPVLTLVYHVDIRYAVAASLMSIVATSSGAAASYLQDSLTNLRLSVFLETGTVSGAIVGFLISSWIQAQQLFLLFGFLLLFSSLMMFRKREDHLSQKNHPWADALKLNGEGYKVENVPWCLLAMFGAGVVSALLGIGSGIFKGLGMEGAMKLPVKVSNFYMLTAAVGENVPPGQDGWRECKKCFTLFYAGFNSHGNCSAGGMHVGQTEFYALEFDRPAGAGEQRDWRFCNKCFSLFFDGYPTKGRCPTGNGHSAQGYNFVLKWGTRID